MAYSLIQLLNLDQFYKDLDGALNKDKLVGTIGNPTHLAAYLAMMLSLFLLQQGRMWRVFAGICLGIIVLTHSITGMICAMAVLVWWLFHIMVI